MKRSPEENQGNASKKSRNDEYVWLQGLPPTSVVVPPTEPEDSRFHYFELICKYFPYLIGSGIDAETDLKGLYFKELEDYLGIFRHAGFSVPKEIIFCALTGQSDIIASIRDAGLKNILYGLMLSNGHDLPVEATFENLTEIKKMLMYFLCMNGKHDEIAALMAKLGNAERILFVEIGWKAAIIKGRFETADLLRSLSEIRFAVIEDFFIECCSFEDNAAFNYLFKIFQFSPACQVKALESSARAGIITIFEKLYAHLRSHNYVELESPFHAAVANNHVNIVQFIKNSRFLNVCQIECGLKAAAECGHAQVFIELHRSLPDYQNDFMPPYAEQKVDI